MERWRPRTSQAAERWQVSYADKLRQLHSYRGRAQQDRVCGHAGGVKAVGLLPAHNLLATGQSYVTDFCQFEKRNHEMFSTENFALCSDASSFNS